MPVGRINGTIPISGRTTPQTAGAIGMRLAGAAGLKATPKPKTRAQEQLTRDQDTSFAKAFGLVPDTFQAQKAQTKTPRGGKPMAMNTNGANVGRSPIAQPTMSTPVTPTKVTKVSGKTNPFLAGTKQAAMPKKVASSPATNTTMSKKAVKNKVAMR